MAIRFSSIIIFWSVQQSVGDSGGDGGSAVIFIFIFSKSDAQRVMCL